MNNTKDTKNNQHRSNLDYSIVNDYYLSTTSFLFISGVLSRNDNGYKTGFNCR